MENHHFIKDKKNSNKAHGLSNNISLVGLQTPLTLQNPGISFLKIIQITVSSANGKLSKSIRILRPPK